MTRRLAGLDALRGIAALGVVAFHFTTAYEMSHPGFAPSFSVVAGRYGVDLFFVISGFVIFMTLERSHSIRDFAISRFARLYPVFWTAILLAVVMAALNGEQIPGVGTILANATMLPRLFGVPFVSVVYWTLSYEFLFYVLAAGFVWSRSDRVEFACLGWLLVAAFAMAYAPLVVIKVIGAPYAYLFVVGIMVYRLRSNPRNFGSWAVLATAIFIAARIPFSVNEHVSGLSNAVLTCAFTVALWLGGRIRPIQLFIYLGEISYSLYLIHDPVGSTLLNVGRCMGVPVDLSIGVALLAVVGLAGIINAKIERPAQWWIKSMNARQGTLLRLARAS